LSPHIRTTPAEVGCGKPKLKVQNDVVIDRRADLTKGDGAAAVRSKCEGCMGGSGHLLMRL
jgi:hypothetical protein